MTRKLPCSHALVASIVVGAPLLEATSLQPKAFDDLVAQAEQIFVVNGIAQTKTIAREVFRAPGTAWFAL